MKRQVRALRRARQPGRAGDRLRRRGRDVARRLRHDARTTSRPTIERLWQHVKPLYDALHCYVRAQLRRSTARTRCPTTAPIPGAAARQHVGAGVEQHLRPGRARTRSEPSLDVDASSMASEEVGPGEDGEARRALLHVARLRPAAQDVLGALAAHAPARPRGRLPRRAPGTSPTDGDLRIKVCIEPTEEDSSPSTTSWATTSTSSATTTLPILFQQGANDGFHEAIGDTIALSVTPAYLQGIGLLDPRADSDQGRASTSR